MKLSDLTRNKKKVLSSLITQEDKSVLCTKDTFIYIPERWVGSILANLDDANLSVYGLFIIVVGNDYTLFNASGMVTIEPSIYETISFDEIDCVEFKFPAGSICIRSLELVQNGALPREIFNTLINTGAKCPYLTRNDRLSITRTFGKVAGLGGKLYPNAAIISALLQHVERNAKNKRIYARHKDEKQESVNIPFRDVTLAAPDTYAKISGSYEEEGINDALVHPSDSVSRAEEVLRI